jgi:molecular chaperone GrpE (heat shock protein)
MNKHRFNNECTFKNNKRVEKQKLLKKSFQTIFDSFLFIRSIIDLYETRFMRERESFFRYIQQKFNDKLLKFVLNVNLSFRAIESFFFKNFVNYLRRNVDIFERIFFDEMMRKRANQIKNDIFQNLKIETKISIALNV